MARKLEALSERAGDERARQGGEVYDEVTEQIRVATEKRGAGDLRELLHAGDTWTIG